MKKILLVEDDPVIGRSLVINLELEGFLLNWAQNIKSAALIMKTNKPDLIILDLGLPDGSGLAYCQSLRESGVLTPIIMLTAMTDEDSVVAGFNAGASDYVRKPFGNKELLVRIRSTLREPAKKSAQIRYGDLQILLEQRKVLFGENEIEINRREFDILVFFIERAEAVVSRESLVSAIDKNSEIFDRTIDSHVSHLRAKLRQLCGDAIQINSVYGVGYRLEKR